MHICWNIPCRAIVGWFIFLSLCSCTQKKKDIIIDSQGKSTWHRFFKNGNIWAIALYWKEPENQTKITHPDNQGYSPFYVMEMGDVFLTDLIVTINPNVDLNQLQQKLGLKSIQELQQLKGKITLTQEQKVAIWESFITTDKTGTALHNWIQQIQHDKGREKLLCILIEQLLPFSLTGVGIYSPACYSSVLSVLDIKKKVRGAFRKTVEMDVIQYAKECKKEHMLTLFLAIQKTIAENLNFS